MNTSTGRRKTKPRLLRILLIALGCAAGLLIGLFAMIRGAENGVFGLRAQSWVRIEKSRFTFNRVYSMASPPFDQAPNALLVRSIKNVPPGKALDICAGQGRNSLYLLRQGWRVCAFDISDKGVRLAEEQARNAGLPLTAVRASAQEFDYGRDQWDLVLLVYAPIQFDDQQLLGRIRNSIKPRGLILIDTPVLMHQPPDKHPRVPGDLERGELPSLFPDFEILQYEESEDTTEWFHLKMPVARFVARKR
jgi:SAM-dependent methyltransferase